MVPQRSVSVYGPAIAPPNQLPNPWRFRWMVSADHDGFVKYWQPNMNNVFMFQAHKDEPIRSIRCGILRYIHSFHHFPQEPSRLFALVNLIPRSPPCPEWGQIKATSGPRSLVRASPFSLRGCEVGIKLNKTLVTLEAFFHLQGGH